MGQRRRILSFLLLAVFLPAVLASSLHRHPHEEAFSCVDCHHESGHLLPGTGGIDDCVLCHFLGLPYIAALAATVLPLVVRLKTDFCRQEQDIPAGSLRHNRSRAPPVLVLFA